MAPGRRNAHRRMTSTDLMQIYQREAEKQRILVKKSDFIQTRLLFIVEAPPDNQLVKQPRKRRDGANAISTEQITRMERELAASQTQVKSVEESYGLDNLHLTVSRG